MPYNVLVAKVRENAVIPKKATLGASGFDIVSPIYAVIPPQSTKLIPTGLVFQMPEGLELQIRPRSGRSLKSKLRIANSPGTIDSDYRGEVGIIIDNIGDEEIVINPGDKICQGVFKEVPMIRLIEVERSTLSCTERGEKGFGSTGA